MPDKIRQVQRLVLAAGTAGRVYFAPTGDVSGETWKVKAITELPNAAVASDGTDYITRQAFKGASTAVTGAATTASTGLTQGTAVNPAITAVGADAQITQSSPLSYRISHAGSGKAVDVSVAVDFEVVRT